MRPLLGRLAVLWLAGISVRVTLLAVPPLLPLIHGTLRLDEKQVGALTGLPILLLAAIAVGGSLLIARLGPKRAAVGALALIAIAGSLRGFAPPGLGVPWLFAFTFLMGAGIAVGQPSLPSLVGAWTPGRIGVGIAAFANGMLIGEILPTSLTHPGILSVTRTWPVTLLAWSAPVLLVALLMAFSPASHPGDGAEGEVRWVPDWKSAETWRLGIVMGCASAVYFGLNAFTPDYLRAAGRGGLIPLALTWLNLGQLPASFLVAGLARRVIAKRGPFLLMGSLSLVCTAAFAIAATIAWLPAWPIIVSLAVGGFATAFTFIIVLAIPPLMAAPGEVHRETAGITTIQYTLAFLIPVISGAAWDYSHQPIAALAVIAAAALVSTVLPLWMRLPGLAARAA